MNKRVMIVEDNSSTRQALSELVRKVEPTAEIHEFAAMEGVYEKALSLRFDLFLLDIIMNPKDSSDTSGIQFADRLRMITQYEFVPIIFITSLEDPKLYAYSRLHSFAYIEKPFKAEQVMQMVSEALRYPNTKQKDTTLYLRKEGVLFTVRVSEIVYIECMMRKLYFHMEEEVIVIGYKTVQQILQEADDENLIHCSRNIIINKRYVENVDLINRQIKMKNIAEPINVGITYWKKVLKEFQDGQ